MEHTKPETCKHCGEPLEPSPIDGIEHCSTCDATNDPKKVPFIRRLLITAALTAVLSLVGWTWFFLIDEAQPVGPWLEDQHVGFWEAFNWQKIVAIWEEQWPVPVIFWIFVTLLFMSSGGSGAGGGAGGGDGGGGDGG